MKLDYDNGELRSFFERTDSTAVLYVGNRTIEDRGITPQEVLGRSPIG